MINATLLIFTLAAITTVSAAALINAGDGEPVPTPWPHQFHSILFQNFSGKLATIDLWYDWTNGRNFNIIQHQLGKLVYDLEWDNGTSFYYTLQPQTPECRTARFEVGIPRPNWLDGATYLGQTSVDGFLCNYWQKLNFIWYYEDVLTNRPVHWRFYTGQSIHVITFEVGAILEDAKWQAPLYCFEKKEDNVREKVDDNLGVDFQDHFRNEILRGSQ